MTNYTEALFLKDTIIFGGWKSAEVDVGALTEELRAADGHSNPRVREIERILADEFGRRYGWKLSPAPFTLTQLARQRRKRYGYSSEIPSLMPGIDHPCYYRAQRWFNYHHRWPAALAVHLYGWPRSRPDVEHLCELHGLTYERITNYPSWYYPGQTELIVYRSALDAEPLEDLR
jgi:hypothetical protein